MAVAQMFKKAKERKQQTDLSEKSVGTVRKLGGAGSSISYNRKNFKGTSRVSIELTKKNGDFCYLNCSTQLSAALRAGEIRIGQLLGFEVIEGEAENKDPKSPNFGKMETIWTITLPATGGKVTTNIDDVEEEDFDASTDWLPEDLAVI